MGRALRILLAGAALALPAVAVAASGSSSVWVTAQCLHAHYKPQTITLACADNGINLEHMRWSKWSSTSATGTGTLAIKTCNPNCASGGVASYPVTATLSDPMNCKPPKHRVFGKVSLKYGSKHPAHEIKSSKLFCPLR